MEFRLDAQIPTINTEAMIDTIAKIIEEKIHVAIGKFFETLLSKIPVRTGFLAGSFLPIARFYGGDVAIGQRSAPGGRGTERIPHLSKKSFPIKLEIKRFSSRRKALFGEKGTILSGNAPTGRTFQPGGRAHETFLQERTERYREYYYPGHILKTPFSGIPFAFSSLSTNKKGFITFTLGNLIEYWDANDTTSHGRGTPWNSLSSAKLTLIRELEKIIENFPDLAKLTSKVSIHQSGKSVRVSNING